MSAPKFFVHDSMRLAEMYMALVGNALTLPGLPDPEKCARDDWRMPVLPDRVGSGLLRGELSADTRDFEVLFREFQRGAVVIHGRAFRVWREVTTAETKARIAGSDKTRA